MYRDMPVYHNLAAKVFQAVLPMIIILVLL